MFKILSFYQSINNYINLSNFEKSNSILINYLWIILKLVSFLYLIFYFKIVTNNRKF